MRKCSIIDPILLLLLIGCSGGRALGQAVNARDEAKVGIQLIEDGEYKQGISHLRTARNREPHEFEYSFEIGRAFLLWGNAKKAEQYFYPLMNHADATPELFGLLANCYQQLDKNKNANAALDHGLARFPTSGLIYKGLGQQSVLINETALAIAYWEKGIEVEPAFADNYLFASKFMLREGNHIWAWLYGETYLNLTNSFNPDVDAMRSTRTALSVLLNAKKQKNPGSEKFDLDVFNTMMPCALESGASESIEEMSKKLSCFINNWNKRKDDTEVPLFELLTKVDAMDRLTQYLFWAYGEADRDEMNNWGRTNAQEFNDFATWIHWNGIELDSQKPFNRKKH